jgi:hypothetical protein
MAQFLGLAQNVNLPTMPVTALNVNALQNVIDMQIQTLDMYCAVLLNAQNLILFSTNQPAPTVAAQPTVKINKPEFNGTPWREGTSLHHSMHNLSDPEARRLPRR